MKTWQIMSSPSYMTICLVDAVTAEGALQKAVEEKKLVAGTWKSFEAVDHRIILK